MGISNSSQDIVKFNSANRSEFFQDLSRSLLSASQVS